MPIEMQAHTPLRKFAARATFQHKLVLDDVSPATRSEVVHTDRAAQGVPIYFRADGVVVFDFPAVPAYAGGEIPAYTLPDDGNVPTHIRDYDELRSEVRQSRFRYMNAFLTCFNSSFNLNNDLEPPVHQNRYIIVIDDRNTQLIDNGSCYLGRIPFFPPLDASVLAESANNMRSLPEKDLTQWLDLLELYYRCSYHRSNHEYATGVILAWTIVERCQNLLWNDYIKDDYKAIAPHANITGQRRKTLLTDRNYTAAIKTQILALGNVLFDQEVEWLDRTRKKRNDFMHSLSEIGSMDIFVAQLAAARMIKRVCGFEPRPFGSAGGWDFIQ